MLRSWLSPFAHVLLFALRCLGLGGTEVARAQRETIRLKLLKVGAQLKVTVRRIWLSLSASYPHQKLFTRVYPPLRAFPLRC